MKIQHLGGIAAIFLAGAMPLVFGIATLGQRVTTKPLPVSSIRGTIKFEGMAPHQPVIDMSKEPSCAAIHTDKPIRAESVVVGPNGGLANVVVYISQGLTGNQASAVRSDTVIMTQKGCQYLPHVVAVDAGQPMKVINADQTLHNVHAAPVKNTEWNKSQQPGAPALDVTWAQEEVAIPVKCNIHPWMRGYVVVVKGPYAVSDESGSFNLNVPPGNYTLTAWQEVYGTQIQTVTIAAGKPVTVNFTFKAR